MRSDSASAPVPGGSLDRPVDSFGKSRVGRPPEDRTGRRREIYLAVLPLLSRVGVKGLSMRAAARAASMSIGGLYYYFPNKRDLVLLPLSDEFIGRYCAEHNFRPDVPSESFSRYTAATLVNRLDIYRPALRAAMELGPEEYEAALSVVVARSFEGFTETVRLAGPQLADNELVVLERALRRAALAALLDRTASGPEVEAELNLLISAHQARHRARTLARLGPPSCP
jgi:AcrR family transcriptional regulator